MPQSVNFILKKSLKKYNFRKCNTSASSSELSGAAGSSVVVVVEVAILNFGLVALRASETAIAIRSPVIKKHLNVHSP